jgi:hypothetical protein
MNRSLVAFLVAPLWVPLVMTPLASLYMFSSPNQGPWVVITTFPGVVFGYGGTLAFGLPAFAVLRSRQMTAFWIAPVLGFMGSPHNLCETVGVDGPTASITCQSWGANDQNWSRP